MGRELDQVVERLHSALGDRLVAIVLFGSRARDDHREGSDWDVFIIAEELPEGVFERQSVLLDALPTGQAFSLLARTPVEFESSIPSLYLDLALDGKIVYDSHGYVKDRLDYLKQLIQNSGLHRDRLPKGDYWWWDNQPDQWHFDWGR